MSRVRTLWAALLLAALLFTAGCATDGASRTPATTPAATSTEHLPPESVTDWSALSHQAEQLFLTAVKQGSVKSTASPDVWAATPYVEYGGVIYRLEAERTSDGVAIYYMDPEPVPGRSVNETHAVAFTNLTAAGRENFTRALNDEQYSQRGPLPSQLMLNRYVLYRGQYYELSRMHADALLTEFSVYQVSTVGSAQATNSPTPA